MCFHMTSKLTPQGPGKLVKKKYESFLEMLITIIIFKLHPKADTSQQY